MLERFLGLTKEEIQQNEEQWREERESPDAPGAAGSDLRAVGITPGGMESDINTGQEMASIEAPGAGGLPPGGPGAEAPAPAAAPGGAAPPAV